MTPDEPGRAGDVATEGIWEHAYRLLEREGIRATAQQMALAWDQGYAAHKDRGAAITAWLRNKGPMPGEPANPYLSEPTP